MQREAEENDEEVANIMDDSKGSLAPPSFGPRLRTPSGSDHNNIDRIFGLMAPTNDLSNSRQVSNRTTPVCRSPVMMARNGRRHSFAFNNSEEEADF